MDYIDRFIENNGKSARICIENVGKNGGGIWKGVRRADLTSDVFFIN